ncbi:hypothetical protein ABEB36_012998 [Hypothenemus hampei]|uniref:tRNA-dihydrouridine(47) synthase [NAD(P)(+)] n=1 Tax=Hypothenemus hampei TaxID=57062 RepID=A0ABD1E8K1_HYPHA
MTDLGVCKIKSEYILPEQNREPNLDHVSDKDKATLDDNRQSETEPKTKRQRFNENKKLKGQNKNRGPTCVLDRTKELCESLVHVEDGEELPVCSRKNCQNSHDIQEYLQKKNPNIGSICYNFLTSGKCFRGLSCRFGECHISDSGRNIVDKDKYEQYTSKGPYIKNLFDKELQWSLRKKTYDFNLAEKLVDSFGKKIEQKKTYGTVTDEDIIKLKQQEKRTIDWSNKLYLGPLTTVGNLPFRRICKEFGADITCGEMAMCSSLLQGMPQEWALIKRHHTEDIFGVQLCANNPYLLTKCGLLLDKQCDIDFVDVNLGCPIDWVFKKGAGTGLLLRPKVLESCLKNLSDIISVPLTVKSRTGVYKDENIAHDLAPKFRDWGVSLITIHGRSREQRYTKSADWSYIEKVAQNAAPAPVFGCGDILSFEDYKLFREQAPNIAGVMLGRGALIKPWIFKEIKEQKLWDISSNERMDIIKTYVNYGLEHWGSDTKGVENTRRFLLEWMSFLYRYIPVGLLEDPPQKINERPPYFRGRDDLETLMSSPAAADWIRITEMLLGKVPDGFKFIPKHKANSYQ